MMWSERTASDFIGDIFLVLNLQKLVIVLLSAWDTMHACVTYVMVKPSLYKFCLFREDDILTK